MCDSRYKCILYIVRAVSNVRCGVKVLAEETYPFVLPGASKLTSHYMFGPLKDGIAELRFKYVGYSSQGADLTKN
jgi:hypothetical protein